MSEERSRKLFLTGVTGFIGSEFLRQLTAHEIESSVCLVRSTESSHRLSEVFPALDFVVGDLADPETYRDQLRGVETIVHVAAATGAATEAELKEINVNGTRELLTSGSEMGVTRFVFVSSIAAGYPELEHYPYAQSKRDAEALVESSGFQFEILRPTIVLGQQSPIWRMLVKLANLPLVPAVAGLRENIQPVEVVDVARALAMQMRSPELTNAIIEFGGPEVLRFSDFLRRIRLLSGRRPVLLIPVPVWPLRVVLRILERVLGERSPISAGQLTPFLYDGTAEENPLYRELESAMTPLDQLVRRLSQDSRTDV